MFVNNNTGCNAWIVTKEKQPSANKLPAIPVFLEEGIKRVFVLGLVVQSRVKMLLRFSMKENEVEMLRKTRLRWFGRVKCRDENSILRRAMELEVEGRRPVGRPKKTWRKVVEEDFKKVNITEDMAEDRKQWRQLISRLTPGVGN